MTLRHPPKLPGGGRPNGDMSGRVLRRNRIDLVRDVHCPMLKSWLDENLPTVVERIVEA
jgi:cell pole-organizing protein PopZ